MKRERLDKDRHAIAKAVQKIKTKKEKREIDKAIKNTVFDLDYYDHDDLPDTVRKIKE